jgi:malonyl CoA-acyl carrier protein transacylase
VPEYARIERDVDRVVGCSVRRLCLVDWDEHASDARYTQPAMFVVNALHHYRTCARGIQAGWYAGHGVGEYNALHAAGVFDLLTGLRILCKRGELMATVRNGSMAAVIGVACKQLARFLRDSGFHSLDIAAFDSPVQTMLSGPDEDIRRAASLFERAADTCYMPLGIGAPCHSRYMARVQRDFAYFLEPFVFRAPRVAVISNVNGTPYPADIEPRRVQSLLVQHMTRPVQWTRSIRYLLQQPRMEFHECGPGEALTRLLKQIRHFPIDAA